MPIDALAMGFSCYQRFEIKYLIINRPTKSNIILI